jgi:hypothetical protein
MKRTIDLALVPMSALTAVIGDACPFTDCPTGRMVYDHRGALVCTDCRVDAMTVEEIVHEHLERVPQ